jgi:signal transduction histidine kinase
MGVLCLLRHRIVAIGLLCLTAISLTPKALGQPASSSHKRILVLHFARPDAGAFAGIEAAIHNTLAKDFGDSLEYTSEYLDLIRFAEPGFQSAMRAYLRVRYADVRFDAIIAASPAVLQFLEEDPSLFPHVPVVFMSRPGVPAGPNSTGIVSAVNFKESLAAALRLHPDATDVFVVSGTSDFDHLYEKAFRNQAAPVAGRRTLTYLSGLPMPQLEERLRRLPPRSIVYYISVSADGTGDRFLPAEAVQRLSDVANAPVYSWHEAMLGHGIVGGRLHSSIKDAEEAARVTIRVLKGGEPSTIPIAQLDSDVYEFDWRQLARWRIPDRVLPAGSVVLFRQSSFWEQYRSYVVAGLMIFAAQLVLIVGLVTQHASRRRVDAQLRNNEAALQGANERNTAILRAVPDLMFVILRDGTYVDYNARDENLLYAPPSAFLGRTVREIMPPVLAEMVMDAIERAFLRDEPVVLEYELQLDETRYFEGRIVRAGADRVLTIVRDVTEAKRTAQLNRELAGRLIASQEVERRRIARELHDDLSQKTALLMMDIERLAKRCPQERSRFLELTERAQEIAADLRNLSYELHPSKLEALGLLSALKALCRDISQQGGVPIAFTHEGISGGVDPNVSLCLYRITQEALHNVARHSHAPDAHVRLASDAQHLTLHIADSGVGFDARTNPAGLGLVSMRERAALLRGEVLVDTFPGGGTRIGVRVPLRGNDQAQGLPSSH